MMNVAGQLRQSLINTPSMINAPALRSLSVSKYVLPPLATRFLGCMPRNNSTERVKPTFRHRVEALHQRTLTSPLLFRRSQMMTDNFSTVASMMRFHPLLTHTPRSLLKWQTMLHPIDLPQTYSPCYEIADSDEKFEIAVELPGMTTEQIKISVEDESRVLRISGQRESSSDRYAFSSRFSQSFSLDPTVELEKMTAFLDNGILTISAPKDAKRLEDKTRMIPISTPPSTIPAVDESDEIENEKHEGIKEDQVA